MRTTRPRPPQRKNIFNRKSKELKPKQKKGREEQNVSSFMEQMKFCSSAVRRGWTLKLEQPVKSDGRSRVKETFCSHRFAACF